jgi:hypothetical protein
MDLSTKALLGAIQPGALLAAARQGSRRGQEGAGR